jgi:two-component system sensor kinase FixL
MSYVTVIWSVVAAGALLLALMYGCVWIMDRQARASLAFAFESLAIVGAVIVELGMMRSTSAAEWSEWVRWNQVPVLVRTVALVAFIRFFFGTGRPWLMALVIGSRLIVAVGSFLMEPNFNFSRIDSIVQVPFLGEPVTVVGQATASPYQWFATLSATLALVFVLDASVSLWKKGTYDARRKVIVIGGASVVSWAVGVTYTQLMIYGGMHWPVLLTPPYLIVLAAMTLELSRDTLRASRLARELRASEGRLDLAASAAGLALWSWEAQSQRVWIAGRAHAVFGLADNEILAVERVLGMIHPDDAERVARVWHDAVSTGSEAEVQFRVRLPDAGVRWVLAHGRSEVDAGGRLISVQGVLRDVTEEHLAREENDELRRDLAHAGRVSVLGTLSSSLAHELSQPLGAILLNAEAGELLLQRANPDLDEVRQILADIRRDDVRAADVIDRLRKLLKRRLLEFAPVSVETLLQDLVALIKSDAVARHITLESGIEADLPAVRGDRVHLSQVLINLVMNGMDAVDAFPPDGRRVTMRARREGEGLVEVSVSDSGGGIPAGDLARIFEPFYTTKPNGMGMGLSVSRTIIEAHGGRLWAENAPRHGAVFKLLIPVFREPSAAD